MIIDVNPAPLKAPIPILNSPEERVADNREPQELKTLSLIIVTPLGIMIDVRVEPANPAVPILTRPEGRIADVKDVQVLNELASIVVTPVADISIVSRSVELWKTSAFIAVTLAPRVTLAGIGPVKPVSTPFTMIG